MSLDKCFLTNTIQPSIHACIEKNGNVDRLLLLWLEFFFSCISISDVLFHQKLLPKWFVMVRCRLAGQNTVFRCKYWLLYCQWITFIYTPVKNNYNNLLEKYLFWNMLQWVVVVGLCQAAGFQWNIHTLAIDISQGPHQRGLQFPKPSF